MYLSLISKRVFPRIYWAAKTNPVIVYNPITNPSIYCRD